MVKKLFNCRVTIDLFKLAELLELTMVLLKENLLLLSILSVIREYSLMEKELPDKSFLLQDYNSLSKYLKLDVVLLQVDFIKLLLSRMFKKYLLKVNWVNLMLHKLEDNN